MFFRRRPPPPLRINYLMVQVALVCDKMAHTVFNLPSVHEIEVLNTVGKGLLTASVTVKVQLGIGDDQKVVTIHPVAGSPHYVEADGKWYLVTMGSEGEGGVDELTEIQNPFS